MHMIVKVIIALTAFAALHATHGSTALYQDSKALDVNVNAKLCLVDQIKSFINKLLETVTGIVQAARITINGLLGQAQAILAQLLLVLPDAIQPLINALINNIRISANTTEEILQECVLASGLLNLPQELAQDVQTCADAAIGNVVNQVDFIEATINQTVQTVNNFTKKLTDCGLTNIGCHLQLFTEVIIAVVQLPIQIAAQVVAAIGLIQGLQQTIQQCATNVLQTAGEVVFGYAPDIVECIRNHAP